MLAKIDQLPFVNQKNALWLLVAMHLAGAVGLYFQGTQSLFQSLTPFNLLATAAIVLHFEEQKKRGYFLFIILTFGIGFFAEVVGVKTGLLFGHYTYGNTLGWKLLDVPLAIGLNWVVLVYCAGMLAKKLTKSLHVAALLGALIMTLIDLLIEPVAITYDFWQWKGSEIPMTNYMGWFVLSLGLQYLFNFLAPRSNNPLAIKLLFILAGFFAVLNLI
ncbi:carotenoid biosynthesis protein [Roseivirga sp. UBA1976]|uniref:carotenoid biosynthesis protein n=1 Tax=Roseivirga sp. UBA1976 TaxID=1947386 RepID=UPI00257B55BA|nr:carotenoid biosynthesis protein [Roseivirga sp. UBA1976]